MKTRPWLVTSCHHEPEKHRYVANDPTIPLQNAIGDQGAILQQACLGLVDQAIAVFQSGPVRGATQTTCYST